MTALFGSLLVGTAQAERADAANALSFNPGLIITDTLFYDGQAMTSSQIQSFLDSKIGSCYNGNCLNVAMIDYAGRARQVSEATGNLVCEAIPAGRVSTAELIYRTQVACGISAKVILVTLQKEQGLVTSSSPSAYALSHAMGMACPDTAPCDPNFAGLGRQIVSGTVQLKIYKAGAFARQPGVQYVQWNPDSSCGGSYVNVQNYATAALYNYTPYQPNSAAMANLYRTGDSCSSYGNRNFWAYYTDWFGDPAFVATVTDPAVLSYWNGKGGASGVLGKPVTSGGAFTTDNGDGYVQVFTGGYVYSSSAGVFTVRPGTPTENAWTAAGWIRGRLGWPVAEESCSENVCSQQFQGAMIQGSSIIGVFDPTILAYWTGLGGASGVLGRPITSGGAFTTTNGDGFVQVFSGGYAYSGPAGVFTVKTGTPLESAWTSAGWIRGKLGWPVAEAACTAGVCSQQFQGGLIRGTTIIGVFDPSVQSYWAGQGGASGPLGSPTTAGGSFSTGNGDGFVQVFTGGYVYSSAAGVFTVKPGTATENAWTSAGWIRGRLGWPVAEETCSAGVCSQPFQGGTIRGSTILY